MKIRYSEFKHLVDVDQFEAAIGFTPLYSSGGNDTGQCLFPENHQNGDTTGKFAIHREKMVYNCWLCGGGSLLSLAMELYDFDVDEATHWMYQFATANDTRTDADFRDYLLELLDDVDDRVETMPYFNERVLGRFTGSWEYFRTRGITDPVSEKYSLRYCDYMMKPAPLKQRDEGLVKIDEDYYGPAAIFPHFWQGKLVGWQHRWMEWDEERTKTPKWLAKYTNTTDFPKHNTLFNYDNVLSANEPVVVVESVPTVLFLASFGVPAVSHFGGDIKAEQLRLLRRFSQGVILAPDNDKTGDSMVRKATPYLERYIPVFHAEKVDLGPKADLGDYAKTAEPYVNLRDHLKHRVSLANLSLKI